MAKQEVPKKSYVTSKPERTLVETDSLDNARAKEMYSRLDEMKRGMQEESRRVIEAANSIGVSNKNQSNPGSTSGGFSYKLKND